MYEIEVFETAMSNQLKAIVPKPELVELKGDDSMTGAT